MLSERLRRKWKSWALLALLIGLGYYAIALHFDWWLFHFRAQAPVREVSAFLRRVEAAGLPRQTLGKVTYDGVAWPLTAIVLKRPQAQRRACIFAGVHGNEPAGVETALQLIDDLARDPGLHARLDFVIVPLANPWGWAHDLRHNGDNRDIARNFREGGTAETAIIKRLLADTRCDLLVDLHEDRLRSGFYMLTYENADESGIAAIAQAVKARGVPLGGQGASGFYHVRESEFASLSRPTLASYARQQGVPQTFIVETPMRLTLAQRVSLQRLALDRLLQSLTH